MSVALRGDLLSDRMADADVSAELERLRAENERLKRGASRGVTLKVSETELIVAPAGTDERSKRNRPRATPPWRRPPIQRLESPPTLLPAYADCSVVSATGASVNVAAGRDTPARVTAAKEMSAFFIGWYGFAKDYAPPKVLSMLPTPWCPNLAVAGLQC